MTKEDFAKVLWVELKNNGNTKQIAGKIMTATSEGRPLSYEEQLELVSLIRRKQVGLFESVEAFLTLVNDVESIIKAQSTSDSKISHSSNTNGDGKNANK